jgi:hypothetical protein
MMNLLATQVAVAATTNTRLAKTEVKAASAFLLDLPGKIVTLLDFRIGDLVEFVIAN